jgi:uncharacterized protein (DUF1800 family)
LSRRKTPYQFVLSAIRAADFAVRNPRPFLGEMARLGMPLYGCTTPDGYKNTEAAWLNPDATMMRIDFAIAFANGNLPIADPPPAIAAVKSVATPAPTPVAAGEPLDPKRFEEVLGSSLTARTREAVAAAPAELRAAMILGSPDFMQR